MRPNFALNFTTAGLALFQRTAAGWAQVGHVDLGSATFDADIEALRQQGAARDPAPMRTRLVIPDDQIRFLDIATGPVGETQRRDMVMGALVGKTPYQIEELAISWSATGDTTQIAAVARETLEEAEGFATRYGFNPVSFVAMPDPGLYTGEPYFGPTYFATHDLVAETTAADVAPAVTQDPPPVPPLQGVHSDEPATVTTRDRQLMLPDIDLPPRAAFAAPAAAPERTTPPPPAPVAPAPVAAPLSGAHAEPGCVPPPPVPTRPAVRQPPTPVPSTLTEDEADKMTIFGARGEQEVAPQTRRKRRLTLIGVAVLATAAVALLSNPTGRSALFSLVAPPPEVASVTTSPSTTPEPQAAPETEAATPAPSAPAQPTPQTDADTQTAAVTPASPSPASTADTPTDAAPSEDPTAGTATTAQLDAPAPILTRRPDPATPAEAAARYAATGIWQRAPTQSLPPLPSELGEIRFSEVTTPERVQDVVGLPSPDDRTVIATGLQAPPNPPAPDQTFALDDRGFVAGTAEGALTPQGHLVYLGPPSVVPPPRPGDTTPPPATDPETDPDAATPDAASQAAPEATSDATSDATADATDGPDAPAETPALALPPPGQLHPKARPEGLIAQQAQEEADPEELSDLEEMGSDLATDEALRPRARPNDFAAAIAAAQAASRPLAVPQIQAPTVQPPGPTRASVAQQATAKRAIRLNDINLIGVMGKPSDRSALVRLSNGRIEKVKVGDALDGGRVAAIGEDELRYVKSNRNLTLRMPKDG
ncbi:hypothetical protein DL237_14125 [Pseudooceanicola sediminis]|uniref:Translation initiation factor 2 n=1 Tax=Pseudooceanicola sediminis TaxID=2211117 RepID=A0A399IY12_9RHOB|nr:hypothetical protein [Pseudooceanicola sediminis]KAA2312063.1 hypothetical protein E0K93_18500 [Puniceibacterium sp. HSS470]RII38073.1 hypothetical protein DL237_14125 [Pseudooceanicola sediminis]|tara:strand:- start:16214 stop:18517 length:2304 start_codon:yes stop_codon:yes gene_type:complete